jgi:hypothetical protein
MAFIFGVYRDFVMANGSITLAASRKVVVENGQQKEPFPIEVTAIGQCPVVPMNVL